MASPRTGPGCPGRRRRPHAPRPCPTILQSRPPAAGSAVAVPQAPVAAPQGVEQGDQRPQSPALAGQARVGDVFPDEQELVALPDHRLELRVQPRGRRLVLVVDHAARLVQHPPAALEGAVRQVHVLPIERRVEFIEAAQGVHAVAAVEGGAGGRVQRRRGRRGRFAQAVHVEDAVVEAAGLLALVPRRDARQQDTRIDGEHGRVRLQRFAQWRQEARLDRHVVVEQQQGVAGGLGDGGVAGARKAAVLRQAHDAGLGDVRGQPLRRAVRAAVVGDDQFGVGDFFRAEQGGQVLLQQGQAVERRDDYGDAHDASPAPATTPNNAK